jgi:endonuclease/exonuclease/phosphatase family metal-dependent hydrolase
VTSQTTSQEKNQDKSHSSYFQTHRLRFVEFNVENLFVFLDHYQGQNLSTVTEKEWQRFSASTTPNKPLDQVRRIAKAVRELDPDVLMLCEVGGRESLSNFSQHFLGGAYEPHLIEGNSDRGIDIGYLVRRGLPFTYDLLSHRHRSIDFLYPHEQMSKETGYDHLRSARKTSHKFSRDVLELRAFESPDESPAFILLLVHLKSQLDRTRIDPGGRDRRRAELVKLVGIYNEIHQELKGQTPIFLGGDFNGIAGKQNMDEEFEAVYRTTGLHDCLELAGVAHDDRFTHQQIYNNRVRSDKQLDYLFVPPEVAARVSKTETWVYRYRDEHGMTIMIPRNLNEKRLLPSDHFPVVLTLEPVAAR